SLALFGDVATEMCIRTDGDEGLFASYSDVQFRAPVRAGDLLEVTAEVVAVGRRSRTLELRAVVVARGTPTVSPSASRILDEPILATTATGVVVVPARDV
ncbi:MAG: hotdog domain-containing protein, partial [Nocardioidaceae bacterium]